MMNRKKIPYGTISIGVLFLFVFLSILYGAFRDFTLTPVEQLSLAQTAEKAKDLRKAERYYLMAARQSNQSIADKAAYRLGRLYRTGGKDLAINGRRAAQFLEQAATNGMADAQYELALLYDVGDKIPENRTQAIHWMNLAAEQGHANALYALAVWMERGYMGEADEQKIVACYEQAAAQNHPQAITGLITFYTGGFHGVEPNKEKAIYWTQRLTALNKKTGVIPNQ